MKKILAVIVLTGTLFLGKNLNESQAVRNSGDLFHQIEKQMLNQDGLVLGEGQVDVTLKVKSGGYLEILKMEGANYLQKHFIERKLTSFRIEDAYRFSSENYNIQFNFNKEI
ncbi:MAG TPA: hypothetical protein PKH65_05465 [Bacteroidia bacterium]|nr:hypothetical protein [Bacteroidia bacterium]